MIKTKFIIIGSGIGGLATGAKLKAEGENDFMIIDKQTSLPKNLHNGLHYLHSLDFEIPFPFEFKKVILTEEIWDTKTNTFKKNATIPEMFEYSKKIMENLRHPSSIMDPGKKTEVWIPEKNNMDDLIEGFYNYIGKEHFVFGTCSTEIDTEKKEIICLNNTFEYDYLISTIPIGKLYGLCGMKCPFELKQKTLYITNYKAENIVPNWLIVLYMSDPKFPPYRISVFNKIISMESLFELSYENEIIIKYLIGDLFDYDLNTKNTFAWETGRIFGLQKYERTEIIETFKNKDIHLTGRYALWNGKLRMDSTAKQAQEIIIDILKI